MNAVKVYQRINGTKEIPYCRYHDFVITNVKLLDECMKRNCNYLYSLYEEEIRVLLKVSR